jgi:hypothetical protein
MAAAYTVIISITEYMNVSGKVGIYGLGSAVQSVSMFKKFPFEMSLGEFIVFAYMIRILGIMSITSVAVLISKHMSKIISGQITCMIVLVLPLALYYMGIKIMKYVSLGMSVAVSEFMMKDGEWDKLVFVKMVIVTAVGVTAVWAYLKENRQ